MKKKTGILILTMAITCSALSGVALAQEGEPVTGVRGTTYNCFFYTFFDVFNSNMTFSAEGEGFSMSRFVGNGYFFTLNNLYSGIYFSVDQLIGGVRADLVMVTTGVAVDDFIFGTGFIVVEYQLLSPLVFHGLRVDQTL